MALNWDDFLNSECYDFSNGQWLDKPSSRNSIYDPQTSNIMPTFSSDWIAGYGSRGTTLLDGSAAFPSTDDSDSISNDTFLKDLDVIQAFENVQSSPESFTGTSKHSASQGPVSPLDGPDRLHQVRPAHRQASTNGTSSSTPHSNSTFPDSMDLTFPKDLSFLNRTAEIPARDLDRLLNPTNISNKRKKNSPDIMSACWISPLCPNNDQGSSPPNPSTCSSGCAPFLFASEDTLPAIPINQLLSQPQDITLEDNIIDIQQRPMKRSESYASLKEATGRQNQTEEIIASPTDTRPTRTTRQTRRAPISQPNQPNDTFKPLKSSRRLPHNQVERKYRESLNSQLEHLRRAVPSLQQTQQSCDNADIEDISPPSKPSKAVILASATAYIKQMEEEKRILVAENMLLRRRIKGPQAGINCEDCSLMQYVSNLNLGQVK